LECVICQTEYQSNRKKKYCSQNCLKIAFSRRRKDRRQEDLAHYRSLDKNKRQQRRLEIGVYQTGRRNTLSGYVDRLLERAKLRSPDTDINRDFLYKLFESQDGKCCITKKDFTYVNMYNCYHNPTAPSLDRIDSSVGYYQNNVQITLSCINRLKNDMPNRDFLNLWKALMDNA